MAHSREPHGDYPELPFIIPGAGPALIARTFRADMTCPHGLTAPALVFGALSEGEAAEAVEAFGRHMTMRPSGLVEVTGGDWL